MAVRLCNTGSFSCSHRLDDLDAWQKFPLVVYRSPMRPRFGASDTEAFNLLSRHK